MNPNTPNARRAAVRREVDRIRCAWPLAKASFGPLGLDAVAIIREPTSTYIIEVEPGDREAVTRSLWVSHRAPIGPESEHAPQWTEGWVD